MAWLLDVNVLAALAIDEHNHHDVAERWFAEREGGFATCPITQGGLVRSLLREGRSAITAIEVLEGFTSFTGHEFWPDDLPYTAVSLKGVVGHRQVADAYLAGLARARSGKVATFDSGMSSLHSDVAVLIPKS
ncbi:TA system VapC family ribonuclease toxin [Glycomyces tenuis]|uniref:TA system VapC family ribonuclease toxin n=1 Tax=Glycomyces tenuis TaxID=58116 RepID=UPI00047A6A99|nr:TA system VapC family ribonuclease toxin [Glycomyces tenuis]